MDALQYLKTFYETINEDARLSGRAGSVEFLTTMRYIEQYLSPGMRIVEIGAGTGRYSHALAQRGYSVDALELIEHNIDVFRQHTLPDEPVTITQGNALALPYPDDCYDITLLLGPMYHLYTEEDQKQAMREAIRITKPGGYILVSYCIADATIVDFVFRKNMLAHVLENNMMNTQTFDLYTTPKELFVMTRKADIDRMIAARARKGAVKAELDPPRLARGKAFSRHGRSKLRPSHFQLMPHRVGERHRRIAEMQG